jgi:hypothetical protein
MSIVPNAIDRPETTVILPPEIRDWCSSLQKSTKVNAGIDGKKPIIKPIRDCNVQMVGKSVLYRYVGY